MISVGMKKDRMKRFAAAAAAALVAASSVTGCASSTDYSLTANGKKVNAGVYINYMLSEMTSQMYQMLYYTGEVKKLDECFEKQIDGKDFTAYVKDKALDSTKEFAAIAAKFDELGLSLSEEDAKSIEDSVSNAWSSQKDYYELEGISRESLKMCSEHSYKKDAIFDHYYSENGTDAVSKETMQNYVNDNYVRFKVVAIPKSSETEEEAKNKENEELKALWEQYIKEAESLDFAGFDKIFDEYNAYKEQKQAEKEAAEAAETDAAGLSDELSPDELDGSEQVIDVDVPAAEAAAEEETESAVVTTAPAEDTNADAKTTIDPNDPDKPTKLEESPDSATAAEDSTETTTTTAAAEEPAPDASSDSTESSDDSASAEADKGSEAEVETDPYANETIVNYTESTDSTSDYYSENYAKLLEEVKKTEYGKVGKLEINDYFYVFMSADVAERTDYTKDHYDTLLHKMKDEEFNGLVNGWIEAASIVVNEKAVKRYTVKEVYDRQQEYAAKNKG